MTKVNDEGGMHIFSQSENHSQKAHMFFVNHLGKAGLVIVLFLISLFMMNSETFSVKFMLFSLTFVSLLTYLAAKFHQKFAHKVIIDFGSREVRFYMYRSGDVIVADFDEMIIKKVPGHVVFILKDRKILYRGQESNELFNCLNRISSRPHKSRLSASG